jgi:hypothetical protein
MSKVRLIVFAYHHNSSNIASLRYRGLIKYLDKELFEVFVISGYGDPEEKYENRQYIYPVDGSPIGKSSTKYSIAVTTALVIVNKLPKFLKSKHGNSWAVKAVKVASKLVNESKEKGQPCLVLGTYSPIDALIAAKCISSKFSIPLIQDFRDGFAFEPLGRTGFFANRARLLIENSVCSSSNIILSATPSINDYFSKKYGKSKAVLLMNGFDPDDQDSLDSSYMSQAKEMLSDAIGSGRFLIGHFGRISMSDASRKKSLEDLVEKVNDAPNSVKHTIFFLFMGQLNSDEEEVLKKLDVPYRIFAAQHRKIALAAMSICDSFLLITGSGIGCVSGKIFEYMSFRKKIVHFSQVRNDAFKILNNYRDSLQYIPDASSCNFNFEKIFEEKISYDIFISEFSREFQAKALKDVLLRLVAN